MHSWHLIRQGCIIFPSTITANSFYQQSYIAFFSKLVVNCANRGLRKENMKKTKISFSSNITKKGNSNVHFLLFLLFVVQAKKSISHICCLWSRCDLDLVCCISSGRRTGVHFHDREHTPAFFWALMFLAQSFQGMTIVNIIFVDTKSFSWR